MTNLLFLMTDHQRADSLGMVQAGVEVCPNLNRLAARGSVFERTYTTCPLCVPARTALATGKYPTGNGVVLNDWAGDLAQDHTTIHECLYRAGYDVAHIGIHHVRVRPGLEERVPFAAWSGNEEYDAYCAQQGFVENHDPDDFKAIIQENQGGESVAARYSNTRVAVWPGEAEAFKDLFWCRQAVDFLRQKRDRPFALFLYLWAPHPPLRLPEPYASRFDPDKIDLPANVGIPAAGEPAAYRRGVAAQLADGISQDEWRRVWAAHLGLVNLADVGLGRVLDALAEAGLAEETVTFFAADHGDHLGQHGMYQKMEMYEPALRVPMLVAGPGIAVQALATPVSHLDVKPTLLDLLGIDAPGDLDGLSLGPSLREGVEPPRRPVFAQYSGNPAIGDMRRCVVAERYKYVWRAPQGEELYDLTVDPLEMENLAGSAEVQNVVERMRQQCRAWGIAHGDWVFR